MKCIKCGKEMEKGYLSSPKHIMWTKEKCKYSCHAFEDGDNVKILPISMFKIQSVESYICKDCHVVVTNYES
ncbi:MAG: PF20097 family protein [Bacilli bacterium]|nr:PF20097 family protein [Bacilli bacterium]